MPLEQYRMSKSDGVGSDGVSEMAVLQQPLYFHSNLEETRKQILMSVWSTSVIEVSREPLDQVFSEAALLGRSIPSHHLHSFSPRGRQSLGPLWGQQLLDPSEGAFTSV
ncbi:uncharacterized protein LACBIDRAFT_299452 [Laccaria bicolor S238N-H82]|uniref:Predicted protein n=1 Tax=Laccaria bicolor (strain S238N-H82 / ATCC MYA-4686) TaxID=486041 RepID=B0DEQ9_LACBS|nr:uncharacterized protein LACBIDRAFT_299452 [Laccaria bicolor S238N-H82]EDR06983.1 predicted protein [Laccaria bicolor S238N-H82]|eukprot:XP_001882356.1 predicted protein [Laccaria bicolor S238N-H82]